MTVAALMRPRLVKVKRSELRQNQRATLNKAKGRTVVVISSKEKAGDKLLLDKQYFDDMVKELRAAKETLEIMSDPKLFSQIVTAAETLDEDVRLGRLHSFEEVFGEK